MSWRNKFYILSNLAESKDTSTASTQLSSAKQLKQSLYLGLGVGRNCFKITKVSQTATLHSFILQRFDVYFFTGTAKTRLFFSIIKGSR